MYCKKCGKRKLLSKTISEHASTWKLSYGEAANEGDFAKLAIAVFKRSLKKAETLQTNHYMWTTLGILAPVPLFRY